MTSQLKQKKAEPALYEIMLFAYAPAPSPARPCNMTSRITSEKRLIWRSRLQDLQQMVQARTDIYIANMEHIDKQHCAIGTKLEIVNTVLRERAFDPTVLQRKQGLEQELHQLHSERRRERIMLWEHVHRLKLELHEVAAEYLGAVRRDEIVSGEMHGTD